MRNNALNAFQKHSFIAIRAPENLITIPIFHNSQISIPNANLLVILEKNEVLSNVTWMNETCC